jgi:hypothetical protein
VILSKKYKVEIINPNKIFRIKGKQVRSPFEAIVSEIELSSIKNKIKISGIDKYKITEIPPVSLTIEKNTQEKLLELNSNRKTIVEEKIKKENKPEPKVIPSIKPRKKYEIKLGSVDLKIKEPKDTEIKIEELSKQSKTLLEKIADGEL